MLSYTQLKAKDTEFLAATGLTVAEFERLLPVFTAAYDQQYRADRTCEGQPRQRRRGGGVKGSLAADADKLLFILVYLKTNPLQTMHGLMFGLSQPQTNIWIHRLLPLLQTALCQLGYAPERDGAAVAVSPLLATAPELVIDGTERRRQRPVDATAQTEHYSGKKKAHTDKNILLVNEQTRQVLYLSPTVAGKTHDKKAADEAEIVYPPNATLDKDTGFQGYEPEGVLPRQPKKAARASTEGQRQAAQSDPVECADRGRTRDCWGEALSDYKGCATADDGGYLGSGDGDCL
jgi:hypothetical protein